MVNALENLHKAGYIHRDIKPENIVTGSEGDLHNLYLLDFGLSKQ